MCIFTTQVNYFSDSFRLCNTMLNGFYHAFSENIWNVGGISAAILIGRPVGGGSARKGVAVLIE